MNRKRRLLGYNKNNIKKGVYNNNFLKGYINNIIN